MLKKITAYLLLLLFVGFYGSITLFPHIHHLGNECIVHSHPFKKDCKGKPVSHSHTKDQFRIIHLLSNFISTVLIIKIAQKVIRSLINVFKIEQYRSFLKAKEFSIYQLRAPPINIHYK